MPSLHAATAAAPTDAMAAWGAALARTEAELAEAARRERAGLQPLPDPADADDAVAARMAETMELRRAADGACSESDLFAAGFTADQLARLADRARAIAGRRALEG